MSFSQNLRPCSVQSQDLSSWQRKILRPSRIVVDGARTSVPPPTRLPVRPHPACSTLAFSGGLFLFFAVGELFLRPLLFSSADGDSTSSAVSVSYLGAWRPPPRGHHGRVRVLLPYSDVPALAREAPRVQRFLRQRPHGVLHFSDRG